MMRTVFIRLCFVLFALQTANAQSRTLIYCGTLIDPGISMEVMPERTIIVENGRVTAIQAGYTRPERDDEVIDLKSQYVMPGWIDSHTHLTGQSSKGALIASFINTPPYTALAATQYARRTLMAGFTAVRDVGSNDGVGFALRDAINRGLVEGPRMFVADALSIMGGHGDPTNGVREDIFGIPSIEHGVVDGIASARRGARLAVKRGSDLIKITATGGVLSIAKDGSAPQFFEDEIQAIVDVASGFGLKVAAHAHGDEGIQRAVRAGVASIEHGTYMSEASMALMKEHGTYLVPTITAGASVADSAKIEGYFVPVVAQKASTIGPLIQGMFSRAYQAGVPIAFGTDAGVFKHGRNAVEFEYMVAAGMPAMEAIRTATYNAADLLGQLDNLGTLEAGKFADIIAVSEDPLTNISTMKNVSFVMKGGVVYKN